jgi:hypothetical protein
LREYQEKGRVNPRPATNEAPGHKPTPTATLHGRWLFFARRAWIALAALTLVLFAASVPFAYGRWRTPCGGAECDPLLLSPEGAKALEGLGLSMDLYAAYNVALACVYALGFWAIGAILFWKRSDDRLVLYASVALVAFGTVQPDTLRWLADAHPVLDLPVNLVYYVGDVSFFVLFCVFPDGRFMPRWTLWAAAAWAAIQLHYSFFPDLPSGQGTLPTLIGIAFPMVAIGLVGSLVVGQVYRYRRVSEHDDLLKTKWVVVGFTGHIAVLIGFVLIELVFGLLGRPGLPEALYLLTLLTAIALSALLIPLSIAIAILRHGLWDIDIIINRTFVYFSLSVVLLAVFAITDELLERLFLGLLGGPHTLITTGVSVVAVGVLFEPLRRRIQAGVDALTNRLAGSPETREAPQ